MKASKKAKKLAAASCPCGGYIKNKTTYLACCLPLHEGEIAANAEQLMRSRYSAYALGLADYLLATWHPDTRPKALDLDDNPRWLGLKVLAYEQTSTNSATVSFIARHSSAAGAQRLEEVSRFQQINGRWYYRDAK